MTIEIQPLTIPPGRSTVAREERSLPHFAGELPVLHHVVLLRHALAGVRQDWTGDDQARPLDQAGLAQAIRLSESVQGWPIAEIWTSPAVRCRHTVMELAAVRRVPVYDAPWLKVDASRDALEAAVATLSGSVLLCVHGESVEALLSILSGHDDGVWLQAQGIECANGAEGAKKQDRGLDKGAAWQLRFENGTLIEASLTPAPSAAPVLSSVLPG